MIISDLAVNTFETSGGGRIFQIPMTLFPILEGYAYVVLVDDYRVLIDSGSGFGESNQQLEAGLRTVGKMTGQPLAFPDLTHILITHGHIDHIGGLPFVRPRTQALLGVHELDRRNLTNYEERLVIVGRRFANYLIEAGVSPTGRDKVLEMYRLHKGLFRSVPVDFTYEAIGMRLGPFEMLHVPGHTAGHVIIRLHDVLFSGDHVINGISPHQSPERLTLGTGLDHYLHSLETLRAWAGGACLTLGGHNTPITDLPARLDEIRDLHRERLQRTLDILRQPHTVADVSRALFNEVHGYNVLLALEEAGAHVEYLYQRGLLEIENLDELEKGDGPVPIRYRCVECKVERSATH